MWQGHNIKSFLGVIGWCVCHADEVDAFLGRRREQDHAVYTSVKTEFMQHWEGFLSDKDSGVRLKLGLPMIKSWMSENKLSIDCHSTENRLAALAPRWYTLDMSQKKQILEATKQFNSAVGRMIWTEDRWYTNKFSKRVSNHKVYADLRAGSNKSKGGAGCSYLTAIQQPIACTSSRREGAGSNPGNHSCQGATCQSQCCRCKLVAGLLTASIGLNDIVSYNIFSLSNIAVPYVFPVHQMLDDPRFFLMICFWC